MFVCAKCHKSMKVLKVGVPFTEMAGNEPYKLWMADLHGCLDCGAEILYTSPTQQPIAQHFEEGFAVRMKFHNPQYQAREWNS